MMVMTHQRERRGAWSQKPREEFQWGKVNCFECFWEGKEGESKEITIRFYNLEVIYDLEKNSNSFRAEAGQEAWPNASRKS